MKFTQKLLLICVTLFLISACNSGVDRFSVLKKCTVLGDESIVYARAHYVKLFYHYNPAKFSDSYQQIQRFDATTHKNTIDTYIRAINKLLSDQKVIEDNRTQKLLSTCKNLSEFSMHFVEQNYKLALNHNSKKDPLTDDFFLEINRIVKFDHEIGTFSETETSFKQRVDNYQKAVTDYISHHRKDIPTSFVNEWNSINKN